MVTLYGVDHYELLGVTNSYFGEYQQFNEPQNASDAATKNYVDVAVANALPGNWLQYTDTNFSTAPGLHAAKRDGGGYCQRAKLDRNHWQLNLGNESVVYRLCDKSRCRILA